MNAREHLELLRAGSQAASNEGLSGNVIVMRHELDNLAAYIDANAAYAVLQREALRLARDALNSLWGAGEDCLLANGPLRLDYVNSVGRHVREAVEAIDAALAKNPNPSGHTSTEASAEKSGNPGNGDAVNGGFGAGRVGTPGVELTGQRCYLAGPMRGYPQFNFPAFFAAAKSLRERGYEVWSPAENDVHQDGFDPAKDAAQPMRHYMKRDLPAVLDADFVAVLPGWERSQGATLEVTVARTCGIPVLDAATLAVAPRVVPRVGYVTPWCDATYVEKLERLLWACAEELRPGIPGETAALLAAIENTVRTDQVAAPEEKRL